MERPDGATPNDSWDAHHVRALREYLKASQERFARELGVRQQTVSEWENGLYRPRGTSAKLLSIVAERNQFHYKAIPAENGAPNNDATSER